MINSLYLYFENINKEFINILRYFKKFILIKKIININNVRKSYSLIKHQLS